MLLGKTWWMAPLIASVCSCSSDPVDIGDDKVVHTGEKLSDYAATWEGYAEAYMFDSDSDAIRIELDEHGEGTFEVGDAPPLPPPTDPNVGYPPVNAGVSVAARVVPPGGLFSGFPFSVRGATVENRRIRLSTSPLEVYKEWCELQTPVLDSVNSTTEHQYYYCVPDLGVDGTVSSGPNGCELYNSITDEHVSIDCMRYSLCDIGGACYCTADGCTSHVPPHGGVPEVMLDAALQGDGDELEGTLTIGGERVTVRMTRH